MLSCATKVILMMMQFQHHLSDEVRARPGAAAPVCAPRASLSGSKVVVCCEPFFVVSSSVRDQAFEVLSSYLSPVVHDTDEQGWEEVTDCSLTSMLRSALSKKDMANNIVQLEAVSEMPDDAQRLQKVRADDSNCTASHACRRHRSSHTHTHIGCCSQPIATAATPRAVSFRLPARTHMMLTHMLGGGVALLACSRTAHCIDVRSTRQSRFGQARHAQEEGGGGCRGTAQVKRRQQRRSVPTT